MLVIVGSGRIAAKGDTANKIETYARAIASRHHCAKFMLVAPTGTLDLSCPEGTCIPIEERTPIELTKYQGRALAPAGMQTWNPVFDVTPAGLVDAIVCERGVFAPSELRRLG